MMGQLAGHLQISSFSAADDSEIGGQVIRPLLPQTTQEGHEWFAQLLRAADKEGDAAGIRKALAGLARPTSPSS
jgi:hypothetical protein